MSDWADDDELTTTFGTLKKAMSEAAETERERLIALLEGEAELAESDSISGFDAQSETIRGCIALIRGESK
jgi:hypothetical protein